MRHLLHILTRPDDPLAREMIATQQSLPEVKVEVIDLTAAADPDYDALLEKIFTADSIEVW
jgi:hypothetical protein